MIPQRPEGICRPIFVEWKALKKAYCSRFYSFSFLSAIYLKYYMCICYSINFWSTKILSLATIFSSTNFNLMLGFTGCKETFSRILLLDTCKFGINLKYLYLFFMKMQINIFDRFVCIFFGILYFEKAFSRKRMCLLGIWSTQTPQPIKT